VQLSEQEAQKLTIEDLGTRKDGQYRVAESTLVKQLRAVSSLEKAFQPGSTNLPSAVGTPR
jgi:carboxyl-terminal processing protease